MNCRPRWHSCPAAGQGGGRTARRSRPCHRRRSASTRRAPARLALVSGLSVLAAVVAAGCGPSLPPPQSSSRVYAETVAAKTAQVELVVHVASPRASTYILADGEVDLASSGCTLTVFDSGAAIHELLTDGDLYFQLPGAARATNGGKPWAEVQLRSGRAEGPGVAPGSPLTEMDPVPLIALLRARPTSVAVVRSTSVDGQAATEYTLTYLTAGLGRTAPDGALPGGVLGLIAQVASPKPKYFPVDVWLDRRGRVVQIEASATLKREPPVPTPEQAGLANQLPTTLTVRLQLGRFGHPVDLVLPAAAEVAHLPLSRLQAGQL